MDDWKKPYYTEEPYMGRKMIEWHDTLADAICYCSYRAPTFRPTHYDMKIVGREEGAIELTNEQFNTLLNELEPIINTYWEGVTQRLLAERNQDAVSTGD